MHCITFEVNELPYLKQCPLEFDLVGILSLFTVFISLLMAAFLLASKGKNYLGNIFLACFLIIMAFDSDTNFLGSYVYPNYPGIGIFISNLLFLSMPLFYLYIQSCIYATFKLRWIHLLHLIPFVVILMVFVPNFYLQDFSGKIEFLTSKDPTYHWEIYFTYSLVHIQIISYIIFSIISVVKYRKLLLENYSNASLLNFNWLIQLVLFLAFTDVIALVKNIFMFMEYKQGYETIMLFTGSMALFYIIWIVYKALRNPEIFRGIDSNLKLVSELIQEESNAQIASSTPQNLNELISEKANELNKFMIKEEPFLDPSLTVADLAKQLNMPTKELSLFINNDLNIHFFDFVNGFRIRKAMEVLSNKDMRELTISEILYDVGFNSKSSFHTAFKKHTHLTPTQYRSKHLE